MHENMVLSEKTCYVKSDEKSSTSRIIFLNLLKVFFIIIIYFYLSEKYGSISTTFRSSADFFPFGPTIFALAFFSILAGPIPGFISGFIGEILFQLSFYNELVLSWCLIIGILGGIFGIYKYKPLRYKELKPVLFTVLIMSIASLFTFVLLMILESITIGLNFLIQSILSVIIPVPISVFLYDKFLADKERHIYHEFLTHHPPVARDHTFHLKFGRTYIYFCTRCSGFVIGALFSMVLTGLISLIFNINVSPEIAILFCAILPIPGLIDWGTQKLLLRKSTSESRLFTGFIIGVALHYISYTKQYSIMLLFLIILYFSIFFILMYFGTKKEMRIWHEEMDKLSLETELEDEIEDSASDLE